MAKPKFVVNGKEYPVPEDLTLGEMCDAERFFGVEFGNNASSGFRMASSLLWIAIQREDPTVTVEDVRALPPEVFAAFAEEESRPPKIGAGASEKPASGPRSGAGSSNGGVDPADVLQATGQPR
jgi:hypothetical protein